ncbi:MAG TPA: hypothetical protein PK514_04370 [Spirochaetota bacterium]|nr:hypothetical protein [Spirochaetota bacterium]
MERGIVVLGIEGFKPPQDMGKEAVQMLINERIIGFEFFYSPISCQTINERPGELDVINIFKETAKSNGWQVPEKVSYQFLGQRGQYEIIVLF